MHIAKTIVFDNGHKSSLDEALDYMDFHYTWPSRVIWDDDTWSYAKGWRWDWDGSKYPAARVGAGAYGDLTLVSRSRSNETTS